MAELDLPFACSASTAVSVIQATPRGTACDFTWLTPPTGGAERHWSPQAVPLRVTWLLNWASDSAEGHPRQNLRAERKLAATQSVKGRGHAILTSPAG